MIASDIPGPNSVWLAAKEGRAGWIEAAQDDQKKADANKDKADKAETTGDTIRVQKYQALANYYQALVTGDLQKAADPPQHDYKRPVAPPSPFPEINANSAGPDEDLAEAVRRLARAVEENQRSLDALERAHGAMLAGDLEWVQKHADMLRELDQSVAKHRKDVAQLEERASLASSDH